MRSAQAMHEGFMNASAVIPPRVGVGGGVGGEMAEVPSIPQVVRATAPADALPPLAGAGMDGGVRR